MVIESCNNFISGVGSIVGVIFYPVRKIASKVSEVNLNPIQGIQDNIVTNSDYMAEEWAFCLQSYKQLADTSHEMVKTGGCLANVVVGAYLYDRAVRRKSMQDPLCGVQKAVGLSIAAFFGVWWLIRTIRSCVGISPFTVPHNPE